MASQGEALAGHEDLEVASHREALAMHREALEIATAMVMAHANYWGRRVYASPAWGYVLNPWRVNRWNAWRGYGNRGFRRWY